MYTNYLPVCIIHRPLIDIHESHYLRFARLYSFFIIRMLTNHTFVLTTPSWNIKLPDRYYQINMGLSTKFVVSGFWPQLMPTNCSAAKQLSQFCKHSKSADLLRKSLLSHVWRVPSSKALSCKHERLFDLLTLASSSQNISSILSRYISSRTCSWYSGLVR